MATSAMSWPSSSPYDINNPNALLLRHGPTNGSYEQQLQVQQGTQKQEQQQVTATTTTPVSQQKDARPPQRLVYDPDFRPYPLKPRKRKKTTTEQFRVLEEVFSRTPHITTAERDALSSQLSMSGRQLQIWFQNRRAKEKMLLQKKQKDEGEGTTSTSSSNNNNASQSTVAAFNLASASSVGLATSSSSIPISGGYSSQSPVSSSSSSSPDFSAAQQTTCPTAHQQHQQQQNQQQHQSYHNGTPATHRPDWQLDPDPRTFLPIAPALTASSMASCVTFTNNLLDGQQGSQLHLQHQLQQPVLATDETHTSSFQTNSTEVSASLSAGVPFVSLTSPSSSALPPAHLGPVATRSSSAGSFEGVQDQHQYQLPSFESLLPLITKGSVSLRPSHNNSNSNSNASNIVNFNSGLPFGPTQHILPYGATSASSSASSSSSCTSPFSTAANNNNAVSNPLSSVHSAFGGASLINNNNNNSNNTNGPVSMIASLSTLSSSPFTGPPANSQRSNSIDGKFDTEGTLTNASVVPSVSISRNTANASSNNRQQFCNASSLEDRLVSAAEFGCLEEFTNLIQSTGISINCINGRGLTPLHAAVIGGHIDVLHWILSFPGVDLNVVDFERHETPLHIAVLRGHRSIVRLLLDSGASPSICDNTNRTPLHRAAMFGCILISQDLIESGAPVDAFDAEGQTPLHVASLFGFSDVVLLLIRYGAKVHTVDLRGNNALFYALKNTHAPVVALLTEAGATLSWDLRLKLL